MTMTKTPHLTSAEMRELKDKHRLELIMQEMGERFEADAKDKSIWRSETTPGLVVNIQRQTFEHIGGTESGDVIAWLMNRNAWSFSQTVRYLIKRSPDPLRETAPEHNDPAVTIMRIRRYESDHRDEEKETSGLYECGIVHRAGKTLYEYLPKPQDRRQELALEIGGERMRDYFGWEAYKLWEVMEEQYHRFLPIQDTRIDCCDECEKEIDWFWKKKPQFGYVQIPGTNYGQKRIRIYPEAQTFAYLVNDGDDDDCEIVICEECKRNYANFCAALKLLYTSARLREDRREAVF
jgi:hypothetical protein